MRISFLLLMVCFQQLLAQQPTTFRVHSHNDYEQNVPFWKALSAGASSIEADVFLKNDTLFVTHDPKEIHKGNYLQKLYLDPLTKAVQMGYAAQEPLQILIDFKSAAHPTLDRLVTVLKEYPQLTSNKNIQFVISGNRPEASEYQHYPSFIWFDHQSFDGLDAPGALDKVAMISLGFGGISQWNGLGRLTAADLAKVQEPINKAHAFHKPFRYWGTPDTKTAWMAFENMGVDFVNTDHPFECYIFLSTLKQRTVVNPNKSPVYRPTYASDGKKAKIENVILLIGDGNGLSQISAGALANEGELSLTQFKTLGLVKTQSADDFCTDSAAGATAMATGVRTNNRAIGTDIAGKPLKNITEILAGRGYVTALITTDAIYGATPSAFYGHRSERSDMAGLLQDLGKSKVNLFMATGDASEVETVGLPMAKNVAEIAKSRAQQLAYIGKDPELSEWAQSGLMYLKNQKKPFFVMIEGAHIDSNGHRNNVAGIVEEELDFDRAVAEALKFADADGHTLVVVTADHETSGFSLTQGNMAAHEVVGDFNTTDHTATMVPLFAYGPQSTHFGGVYDNTAIFSKIMELLGASVNGN